MKYFHDTLSENTVSTSCKGVKNSDEKTSVKRLDWLAWELATTKSKNWPGAIGSRLSLDCARNRWTAGPTK